MAEPIKIVISKTQETALQPQTATPNKASGKESVLNKAVNVALVDAGKQIVSAGINQYGNITGNTLANKQLDSLTQVAGYATQILVGGWVGAISVATQIGIQSFSNSANVRKANQEAQLLYQRSGNATIDGGRGTYD